MHLDETGKDDRAILRKRGRDPPGVSPVVPFNVEARRRMRGYPLCGLMSCDGLVDACVHEGTLDEERFLEMLRAYVVSVRVAVCINSCDACDIAAI